jgi:hypothetical protein
MSPPRRSRRSIVPAGDSTAAPADSGGRSASQEERLLPLLIERKIADEVADLPERAA